MPSRYDDELWELVPDRPAPPPEHRARFVASLPRARDALDLGCGDGRLTEHLPAERLVAADVSAVALERARARLAEAEVVELEPDAPLPFGDGEFDLVLCAETIEHVRDVQLLLSEARRVLRPGGRLALTTPAHGRLTAARSRCVASSARSTPSRPTSASSRPVAARGARRAWLRVASLERARGHAARTRDPVEPDGARPDRHELRRPRAVGHGGLHRAAGRGAARARRRRGGGGQPRGGGRGRVVAEAGEPAAQRRQRRCCDRGLAAPRPAARGTRGWRRRGPSSAARPMRGSRAARRW